MSTLYLKGLEQAFLGNIDFENDRIDLEYMAPAYTPNAGTDQFWADISANQASGAPTLTLASKDIRIDSVNGRIEFDAADVTSPSITTSTDKFILKLYTGTAATETLIACVDITEGTLSPVSGTLALTFDAEGLFGINAT